MGEKTFKLTIEYDGTDFCGWQRQKADRTVQETIETAIETIVGAPVPLAGSGRTDSGVHALGQTASFSFDTRLRADELACPLAECKYVVTVIARPTYSSAKYHSAERKAPVRHE